MKVEWASSQKVPWSHPLPSSTARGCPRKENIGGQQMRGASPVKSTLIRLSGLRRESSRMAPITSRVLVVDILGRDGEGPPLIEAGGVLLFASSPLQEDVVPLGHTSFMVQRTRHHPWLNHVFPGNRKRSPKRWNKSNGGGLVMRRKLKNIRLISLVLRL